MTKDAVEIKSRIGVVPEGLALFERLTGPQLLDFIGRMYGLSRETSKQRTSELLDFMELSSSDDKLVADYSHGMKKKIALAAAIIHRPEVLFLDEPFEGVDAVAATFLKNMLHRFIERGGTVFLTSHVLEVVERLCTHIGIIDKGRIVANDSIANLRAGVTVQGVHDSPVTLEQIFLSIVGGGKDKSGELQWL
jgi:ABC-2 type transport system ATP-binding protein